MDMRTGSPADERRTRFGSFVGPIVARPSPSCAHDDDRLRLPAASPSRSNSAEKKESTDPRLSQLCPPYVTPSSSSSLEYHRSDARIVENGFAAGSGMSNSAKVGLGRALINPLFVSAALGSSRRLPLAKTPPTGFVTYRTNGATAVANRATHYRRRARDCLKLAKVVPPRGEAHDTIMAMGGGTIAWSRSGHGRPLMVQKMRELRQSASIGAPSGLSSEAKTNWPTSLASKVKLSRLALAKSGSGIDAARSGAGSNSPVRHGLPRAVKCASWTGVPAESSINRATPPSRGARRT